MIAGAFSVKISFVDSDTESPHEESSENIPTKKRLAENPLISG